MQVAPHIKPGQKHEFAERKTVKIGIFFLLTPEIPFPATDCLTM